MTDAVVSLEKVIEAFEWPDEWSKFVDKETGEVIVLPGEVMSAVEDGEETEDLDLEESDVEAAKVVLDHPDRYLSLPDKFEIHEWDIMRRFAESRGNRSQRDELIDAIHGSGAFRFFKSTIRRLGIEEEWYQFRDNSLLDIAKEWLEDNGLKYK